MINRSTPLPIVLMSCALLAACASTGRRIPHSSEDNRAILVANSLWDSASVKRDPVILANLMADDFIHINFNGNVGVKTGIIRSLTTNRGFGYAEHRSDSVTIKNFGNTAVMNGLMVRLGDKGRPQDDGVFRFTRVWVRTPTGWKVTANQYTLLPGLASP